MNYEHILISDITHTGSKTYSPNLTPYPIASIKSHLIHYSKYADSFKVEIFKDPQKFIDSFLKNKPIVVGFSNYVWNSELANDLAREIKSINPQTLIIFGGPNFPLENESREKWLKSHPAVDVYVIGEGEEPFTELVELWFETRDIEKIKKANVKGCFSIVDNKLRNIGDFYPRISNLDKIPSPYLEGYLDEFLEDPRLSPLLESNRGCPFTCTFCVDGIKERSKVYNKSISRFEKELEYVALHYKGKMLTLADLNFGMYGRDIDISKSIAKIKKKYGYPHYIQVSAGKNNKTRVLDCAKILEGSMGLAASVQSLDKEVLQNVKRDNISEQQLLEMTQIGNDMSANTYSEVILALPGDSKKKHFETVFKLADAEMKIISMYQCMILEGSELGAKFTKNAWNLKTKYRVLPRCFGIYNFNGKEILSADIEEICVSTSTLPIEDYYECRSFTLTIGLFYQDRIFFELYQFLKNFNIKPSEILLALHQKRMSLSKKITELYRSFDNDTKTELWDNKDNLRKSIKSNREVLEKYAKGELGVNVLFKHRAISSLEMIDDLHNVIFSLALELLYEKSKNLYQIYKPFLNELKIFGILRKRNVFDYEKRYSHTFTYDFKNLAKNNFAGFPKKLEKPIQITFYSNNDQKDMIKEKIIECGSNINGIGKILSKMLGTLSQRTLAFDDGTFSKQKNVDDIDINLYPGEFV